MSAVVDDTPPSPVVVALDDVLDRVRSDRTGNVADYIPELATVDADAAGLAVVSVLGHCYEAGDARVPFTIQSISKPFVYALALSDLGFDGVHRIVGLEPSGGAFNDMSLDPAGRPANPMINAGAILTSGLVAGRDAHQRVNRVRATLSAFAGRELSMDERVYQSERATGDRNRALAYGLKAMGALTLDVEDVTDAYFRQCSMVVSAFDVAVMAATLANGGVNPVTRVAVVDERVARHTLAVMSTCGMYDGSGEWAVRVGMPAKSGVGGGIAAVTPGQFGIGVFSPRLNAAGNSVRGVAALTLLSQEFGLHLLSHPVEPVSPVLSIDDVEGLVLVLRGELDFVAVEQIAYEIRARLGPERAGDRNVTLDMAGVTRVEPVADRLLHSLAGRLEDAGFRFVITDRPS